MGLDKLHVLNALQIAYQTTYMRTQASAVAAHCAGTRGVESLTPNVISRLSPTGIPAGLHSTVVQLLLGLLTLCAPYKGHQDLKILTTCLKMLGLTLSDAALQLHIQHSFTGIIISSGTASGSSPTAAAAADSASIEELASAILGPLVTVIGPFCVKGQADHPFAAQLFPPMPWDKLLAAEEGGDLLPLFGGLLRNTLLVMSPTGGWVLQEC
jgi:hypothetical protein